ncbi:MAG: HD domain-containing protein [Clostridia bacterium]|nr:HD domain-containing protein [Clostridia bacterium]
MQIKLPKAVEIAINKLKNAGHEAYIVGGCVRDALRGEEPHDYDMTTSALPEETKEIFSEYRIIETGMKHGTVTALIDGEPLEITTFRVDGAYTDHRRPEEVTFTRSLEEDVARRDFTVNAMAYSPDTGVMDFWGGRDDLRSGIIRAVGEPDRRFNEDALRIMRAMRFASVLDFQIDAETSDSMIRNRGLLQSISAERINVELSKLLLGDGCERILTEYAVILTEIIPELAPAIGFDQCNYHHIYDVYTHIVKAVVNCPKDRNIRMAALMHDIGKPEVFTVGNDGVGHFYGHSERSVEIAENVLTRLKFDNDSKNEILTLIKYHDPVIPVKRAAVGRWARKLGMETLFKLLDLKAADNLAQAPEYADRLKGYDEIREIANEMIAENACFTLKNLAVNGGDLIKECGYTPGKSIGETLSALLDAVISEELPNERAVLIEKAKSMR